MTTLTIAGCTWTLEPTGLQHVAYTLTSGKKVCKGIRHQVHPDIIVVLDTHSTYLGAFEEKTGRALQRLR